MTSTQAIYSADILAAEAARDLWRPFEVTAIREESDCIRSFYMKPADKLGYSDFLPGQYVTIRVSPDQKKSEIRTYTLSSAPGDQGYRISVKRESNTSEPEGVVSCYLHDSISVGDHVDIRAPRGEFVFDTAADRPAVMIAGGVGITPFVSMTRQAILDSIAKRYMRPITVIHAAHTTRARAFAGDFTEMQNVIGSQLRYISVIGQPDPGESQGTEFHVAGRINKKLLQAVLPIDNYDFYLCGPTLFMQDVYNILLSLAVSDTRIFAESFGSASLKRVVDSGNADQNMEVFEPVDSALVSFEISGITQQWDPKMGSLLELAESAGLSPEYGCRNGACGLCAVKLKSGQVGYAGSPNVEPDKDKILLCCSVPAKSDETLRIEI